MTILNDVGNWFKGAGNSIYDTVIKPIGNGISKVADFTYDKALNPIGDLFKTYVKSTEKLVSGTVDTVNAINKGIGNTATGLGSFLSSPMSYLLIGGVALVILPKLL
jgi:hypothetical protein